MGIFDEIGKTISSAASSASQKTKDVAEITRLNFSISSKENELDKIYMQIGKNICQNYEDVVANEFPEELEKVKDIKEEIANMRRKLLALKNVVLCSDCGAENAPTAKFCVNCGAKLADQIPVIKAEPVDNAEDLPKEENTNAQEDKEEEK